MLFKTELKPARPLQENSDGYSCFLAGIWPTDQGPISWLCLPPNSALTVTIPRYFASAEFLS